MTLAPTAPGVYVTEIPSGNRSIAGVSTSLTAFVGPALRGPVGEPTAVSSWADFQRRFGGLWVRSAMSQSVRHYFANGGARALVVRVVNGDDLVIEATPDALALPGFDALTIEVTNEGADVRVSAVDGAGAVIEDAGTPHTLDLVGVSPGLIGTSIDGQPDAAGTVLAHVVGGPLTDAPPDGTSVTRDPGTGTHVATIGNMATTAHARLATGLVVEATDAVASLPDFDHLRAVVTNSGGTTFDLEVSARRADDSVVEVAGTDIVADDTGLDVADPADVSATVAALSASGIALATVRGAVPSLVPADGTSASASVDGRHRLVLAAEHVELEAADHGAWGNRLRASIDTIDAQQGTFHLELREVDEAGVTVVAETHLNVSTDGGATGSLERTLELRSRLARQVSADPAGTAVADAGEVAFVGGADGGAPRLTQDVQGVGATEPSGLQALARADLFNLLCVPLDGWSTADAAATGMWAEAVRICEDRRAFLLVDPPDEWSADPTVAVTDAGGATLTRSANAALYYPRVRVPDPLREARLGDFAPCGVVAGVIARTDADRGVWKAPAGTAANLAGVPELATTLTDAVQGDLNALGVSCLRSFPPYGRVVWGARTLDGADLQASEWKYVPVRRTALYLEESLLRGSRWAVFEPNGEALWAQLRLSIRSFMHRLYRQGAFAGASPRDAYLVKCDAETTTPADIDRGIVNVLVGFAPLRPAEFVIISLQQLAGQAGQ